DLQRLPGPERRRERAARRTGGARRTARLPGRVAQDRPPGAGTRAAGAGALPPRPPRLRPRRLALARREAQAGTRDPARGEALGAAARRADGRHGDGGGPGAHRADSRGAPGRSHHPDGRAPHGGRARPGAAGRGAAPRRAARLRPAGRRGRRPDGARGVSGGAAVTYQSSINQVAVDPAPTASEPILRVSDLTVTLGGSAILHGVTFDVAV